MSNGSTTASRPSRDRHSGARPDGDLLTRSLEMKRSIGVSFLCGLVRCSASPRSDLVGSSQNASHIAAICLAFVPANDSPRTSPSPIAKRLGFAGCNQTHVVSQQLSLDFPEASRSQ